MRSARHQIRICQNPDCGLRFPWVEGQSLGDRCPFCLGATLPVLEIQVSSEVSDPPRAVMPHRELSVLVDNVRSAWNVGSILRSADGFGFTHAYLCGITPTAENAGVKKTALGADEFISWSAHKDAVALARQLQHEGNYMIALESTEHSIPLWDLELSGRGQQKLVLVVGSEVAGVDPGLLELADQIVCLPMHGRKRSFNVAVAFGAAACQISMLRR